ncbi:hypothetical protein [Natronobacterium texcoconense]|uniref:Uncharacterized protein n=1 Tax=Natronobacterium texcoconense TaxID=1095778 RepID=A0A1H1ICC1_NATTX|nr:hypothetical protein [Natronobacterium texcoconense]SDR35209.1 hypothetical protein SAMN04489842_3413 [Natronobacterium texcoconense]
MHRRHYLAAGSGLIPSIVGSTGVTASSERKSLQDEPEPLEFEGSGATVSDEFELEGGVTIAETAHDGESNFIVELIPTDGDLSELLVNVVGDFDGASGVLAEAGTYLLDIDADGAWELEILQPRATEEEADTLPVELECEEPAWDGPFLFEGLGQANGTHEGSGNFIVEVLPQDGQFSDLVFNEIGQFEGETTFDIDGIGYVTIEADGPWSLTME